jgi:hypothetical protein
VPTEDELCSLHFAVTDVDRVLGALTEQASAVGGRPVDPEDLPPFGRWTQGEDDPTQRRFVVAPPAGGWTTVLPSMPDWDHDVAPALAARLGCRAACLMLHDGDVLTLHLHDRERLAAAHVSSPVHFDLPERPEGELDFDVERALPFCRPGTRAEDLRHALTPPGRIDVDGRLALRRVAALLGLGPRALSTYALAIDRDGSRLRADHADCRHVAFRLAPGEEGGRILPFPGPRRGGGA